MQRLALKSCTIGVFSYACNRANDFSWRAECKESSVDIPYSSSEQLIFTQVVPGCKAAGNNFMVVYDKRTRNPKYVVERLYQSGLACSDDDDANEKKKKRKPFYSETAIESESFRSNTKDYTNVPYDRGHMAPAADFICSPDIRDATFTMANICPQAPAMNKGFWAKFEAWLRFQLTSNQCEEMIVITGPVYAPIYVNNEWVHINRTIGTFPRLVHVPTHFFKVVVCLKKGANSKKSSAVVPMNGNSAEWWPAADTTYDAVISVGAFMVPNNDNVDSKTPLAHTAVRLDQLEALLGYQLVPEVINAKSKQKLDSVVPAARDLQLVLDGHNPNEPSNLLFTNGKTALLLPSSHLTSNTSQEKPQVIPPKYANATISPQSKNSVSGIGLVKIMHLCEQVDCNRPLFGK